MKNPKRNFNYPTKTSGSTIAEKVRAKSNTMTKRQRATLLKRGMKIIG